jgi:hypothetical protein
MWNATQPDGRSQRLVAAHDSPRPFRNVLSKLPILHSRCFVTLLSSNLVKSIDSGDPSRRSAGDERPVPRSCRALALWAEIAATLVVLFAA